MLEELLKSGKYEITEQVPVREAESIEKISLFYLPTATECPKCGSPNIIKKNLSRRSVIDIRGNQPVDVTIVKQRYKCAC